MGEDRSIQRRQGPPAGRAPRSGKGEWPDTIAGPSERTVSDRGQTAIRLVRRGVLQAEEKYLVKPSASLGIWFARVQEPICVACRVTLVRLVECRRLGEADVAAEQVGLQADICAEAIRAAAQLWRGGPSPEAQDEILALVAARTRSACADDLSDVLVALVGCSAALEPVANGLREEDLPMGDPTDREAVTACLLDVVDRAFGVIHALC
jgi:hypothetical protein